MKNDTGNWNRNGRRSGGDPRPIIGGRPLSSEPAATLSMQCFENRHADCRGDCSPFFSEPCGCACHERAKA
jgi:hypothetical protein